jgi:dihydrolipoamide dehydrogenase
MVIVGGGYIACEMSQFFLGMGTRTTLIERGRLLLKDEDLDVQKAFQAKFSGRIDLRTETALQSVSYRSGRFHLRLKHAKNSGFEKMSTDRLLYAIGREPNTEGFAKAGFALDAHGFVKVNAHLETNHRGVYALGDVNGRALFTHAANAQRKYLEQRILEGCTAPIDHGPMPHAIFTDPEIAAVGESEQSLRARGAKFIKAIVYYSEVAKGRAMREQAGLAKLLATPSGEILGFHIVGPDASILLHQVIPVIRFKNHVASLTKFITIHPSLSELVVKTALRALDKLAARKRS